MRTVATQLISDEAKASPLSASAEATKVAVVEKLRPHLSTLMGKSGFRALLSRALALAVSEAPWLAGVQVNAEGFLELQVPNDLKLDAQQIFAGHVALVAHLLGLLVAFIGEILTIRLVCETWPLLPVNDYFNQGDDHEETN
ncbi:MAG: hypothetical protein CFE26_01160 [Verrucomicrobiales bacterium VVV1]|nr:MAG: hypothetical protein CFE26_01160 [Verrucomicrobiales bacterium VVV1]